MSLELEVERTQVMGDRNQASLTLNNTSLESVMMRKKKDAQAVAYLTGALDVAKAHPHLLEAFAQALKNGRGKVLKEFSAIPVDLDPTALQSMRNSLAEAHLAGLPAA